MSESIVYCVDSSALIDLRITYPRKTFVTLWQRMGDLVAAKRMIAPREVWREVRKDDELPAWIRGHRMMFVRLTPNAVRTAVEIMARFPGLVDPDKETPDADPFLIALALDRNSAQQDLLLPCKHVVLTCEKPSRGARPKIPDVCREYGLECMAGPNALTEFFAKEAWVF
jgi:hypothetical protein